MCAALDLLARADTRKVAILGDMFELGEDAEKLHGEVGSYAAKLGIDVIICVGELSENMAREAEENGSGRSRVYYYPEKEVLLQELEGLTKPGDTVLVKASHGMDFGKIVEKLKG